MSIGTSVFLAVLLLLGNAFFVAAEFALVSARRTQIEPRADEGSRLARTTLRAKLRAQGLAVEKGLSPDAEHAER